MKQRGIPIGPHVVIAGRDAKGNISFQAAETDICPRPLFGNVLVDDITHVSNELYAMGQQVVQNPIDMTFQRPIGPLNHGLIVNSGGLNMKLLGIGDYDKRKPRFIPISGWRDTHGC